MITFTAPIIEVNGWNIIHIPIDESAKLPSRGMVMADTTINGTQFKAPLEPDGLKSHWFRIEDTLLKKLNAKTGDTVKVVMESTTEWSEPDVPEDIQTALSKSSQVLDLWEDITPAARWDWIRWIRATKNPDTRKKRIEVTISKMSSSKRRPCCFNRSMCTEMKICGSGVLKTNV